MKKINCIQDLHTQRKLIRENQLLLQEGIKYNWQELKESIKPQNMILDTLNSLIVRKTDQVLPKESFFKNLIVYGLSIVAKKISEKAGDKISHFFAKD